MAGRGTRLRLPVGGARRVHGREPDDPGAVDQLRTRLEPGPGLLRCLGRGHRGAGHGVHGRLPAVLVPGLPRPRRARSAVRRRARCPARRRQWSRPGAGGLGLRARAAGDDRRSDRPTLPPQRVDHGVLPLVPALAARDRGQPDHPRQPRRRGHRDGPHSDPGEVDVDLDGPARLRRVCPGRWSGLRGGRSRPSAQPCRPRRWHDGNGDHGRRTPGAARAAVRDLPRGRLRGDGRLQRPVHLGRGDRAASWVLLRRRRQPGSAAPARRRQRRGGHVRALGQVRAARAVHGARTRRRRTSTALADLRRLTARPERRCLPRRLLHDQCAPGRPAVRRRDHRPAAGGHVQRADPAVRPGLGRGRLPDGADSNSGRLLRPCPVHPVGVVVDRRSGCLTPAGACSAPREDGCHDTDRGRARQRRTARSGRPVDFRPTPPASRGRGLPWRPTCTCPGCSWPGCSDRKKEEPTRRPPA